MPNLFSYLLVAAISPGILIQAIFGNTNVKEGQKVPVNWEVRSYSQSSIVALLPYMGIKAITRASSGFLVAGVGTCSEGRTTEIEVTQGSVLFRVPKLQAACSRVTIHSGESSTVVKGTILNVQRFTDQHSIVGVAEGKVDVEGQNTVLTIQRDYYTRIQDGQPPEPPRIADTNLSLIVVPSAAPKSEQVTVTVAEGNTLVDGQGTVLPVPAIAKLGDLLAVRNPLGDFREYKIKPKNAVGADVGAKGTPGERIIEQPELVSPRN